MVGEHDVTRLIHIVTDVCQLAAGTSVCFDLWSDDGG